MMSQTLSLFLIVFWLSLRGSLGVDTTPEITISSNVRSLELGASAKLTCTVVNFAPGSAFYEVIFCADKDYFCHYYISDLNSSGHRSTAFRNDTEHQPSLGRHSLSSTFPVYEVTVTPTLAGTINYYCNLYQTSPRVNAYSTHLSLTVTPPPPPAPTAVLSSNVPAPLLRHPFTLSCTFPRVNPLPVKYSVTFNSLRDGQLAAYDVNKEKTLLAEGFNEKVDLSQGPRSTYPNFDLLITEKVDNSSAYWCALVEEGKASVQSNTWPLLVQFTASKPAENQRAATCSVGATGLEPTGKEYTVQFLSDLGPKSVNLLAEYSFKRKPLVKLTIKT